MPARQIHTVHNFSFRLFDFTKKAKNRQKNKSLADTARSNKACQSGD